MTLTIQTFLIVCPLLFLAGLIDGISGGGGWGTSDGSVICRFWARDMIFCIISGLLRMAPSFSSRLFSIGASKFFQK